MSNIINTSKAPEKVRLPVRVKVIAVVALLVIAVVIGLALMPAVRQTVSTTYANLADPAEGPCGGNTDLLERYNGTVRDQGADSLEGIATEIRAKSGYNDDPTCVYMLMVTKVNDNEARSAITEYERLLALEAEGKKLSNRIDDGNDKAALYDLLKKLKDEKPQTMGEG